MPKSPQSGARTPHLGFRVSGLSPATFRSYFQFSDEQLSALRAERIVATVGKSYPCRVSLEDASAGETLLLINYQHQPAPTPFQSNYAIYIREQAGEQISMIDDLPGSLRKRLLAVRGYSAEHMLLDADVCEGRDAESLIYRLLNNPDIQYLHVHYAKFGCYAARIDRLSA